MHHARRRGILAATIRWRGPMRDAPTDDPTTGSDVNGGAPTADSTGDGDQGDGKADAPKTPTIDGDVDKDRAARALAAARASEEKARKRAQATEAQLAEVKAANEKAMADLRDKFAIALGLKPDSSQDPTELAKQAAANAEQAAKERDEALARVATMQVETAVVKIAAKANADAAELLDSTKFRRDIAALEPDADGFDAALADIIKAAVESNPKRFGVTPPAPARRGADITGTAGGPRKRPAGLGAAIARKYTS